MLQQVSVAQEEKVESEPHQDLHGALPVDAEQARRECVSKSTRSSYSSYLRGIGKWLRQCQPNPDRFFYGDGTIDIQIITPQLFEQFILSRSNDTAHPIKVKTLEGYRSAIKYVYRLKRMSLPVEYGTDLATFFGGLGRIEADRVQAGTTSAGKEPLSYKLYSEMCRATMMMEDGGFSRLFLTTLWNLMCRSMSVQTIDTLHLTAIDDSIGVMLYKTKTNQDGHGPKDPRHMYANALSPDTCWATSWQSISRAIRL